MFKVIRGREVTDSHIAQAVDIDRRCYPSELQGIFDVCKKWHQKNPLIYTMILDDEGRVAGYINAMPVDTPTVKAITDGRHMDIYTPVNAIQEYNREGHYNIYIASIAIDPKHQGLAAFKSLIDGFFEGLLQLGLEGKYVGDLYADVVSVEGAKLASLLGMKPLGGKMRNSQVFKLSMSSGEFRAVSRQSIALKKMYSLERLGFLGGVNDKEIL
nr:hypothetical protein BdHM001_36510 [Bdellovibrio sp. HM001]